MKLSEILSSLTALLLTALLFILILKPEGLRIGFEVNVNLIHQYPESGSSYTYYVDDSQLEGEGAPNPSAAPEPQKQNHSPQIQKVPSGKPPL